MKVTEQSFSKTNEKVKLFVLENNNGVEVKITNYGGIITSWLLPESNGKKTDIVLGFNSYEDYRAEKYLTECPYFGAIIGRFANRIKQGKFAIAGKEYKLAVNNGENHLHGGREGFDKKLWDYETKIEDAEVKLTLKYFSPDGEENYPGNLQVAVDYILNNKNELRIKYTAAADKETVLNLTQHSYFNLKGEGNGDVLDHIIEINSDYYTKPDENLIPTGEKADIANTPLDVKNPIKVGTNIGNVDGNGFDHNYILNKNGSEMSFAARVKEPESGKELEVFTTKPGVQFYTGNFLDGSFTGKSGKPYNQRAGFCLETQYFPDSPNQPEFPSPKLNIGDIYEHETVFKLKF